MLFFYPLKLDVLKNRVLERSGLDFGASGPRFWRLWGSILPDLKAFLEDSGLDFGGSGPRFAGGDFVASRPRFSSLQANILRKNSCSASFLP